MLIFFVAVSAIAVMVFVEWQYSRMRRRVRVKRQDTLKARSERRGRRR